MIDKYFRVKILSKTERPNLLSYLEMHQCYSEGAVIDDLEKLTKLSEKELGERLVKHCVKYGHWGVLESPSISFNIVGFPHSVLVQARTHRIGVSFSAQSQRYTFKRIVNLVDELNLIEGDVYSDSFTEIAYPLIEKYFYFRPIGYYSDREGNKYHYSQEQRLMDIDFTHGNIMEFKERIKYGYSPEHARDFLFQNIRQNFVVTFNARSLLHFCDLRIPKDAQLEIRTMAESVFNHFKTWMPEVAEFYEKNRLGKNKLAP
jgi:thymidylate synthase (FAD)